MIVVANRMKDYGAMSHRGEDHVNMPMQFRPPQTPLLYEPRCEKTGLRGLRPGPT